jgi:hypothetical protein
MAKLAGSSISSRDCGPLHAHYLYIGVASISSKTWENMQININIFLYAT